MKNGIWVCSVSLRCCAEIKCTVPYLHNPLHIVNHKGTVERNEIKLDIDTGMDKPTTTHKKAE